LSENPAEKPVSRYPWLKPATEYGPLVVFFASYWIWGLIPATGALVAVTLAATLLSVIVERRIPWMPVVTAAAVGIFGGLTLIFQDETFIKMKPTILQTLMALALLGGALVDKWFLKMMLSQGLALQDKGWQILTYRFAGLLLVGAVLNEIVWRTQSDDVWVSFKVFGLMGLTFVFMLAQAPLINRYRIPEKA
jgi:intracellular septation protein